MPTVGARSSTRVFVPKHHGDPARVLRSGKRFTLSMPKENDENELIGPDLKRWWLEERKIEWKGEREEIESKEIKEHKKFGTVYSRKRPRSTLSNDSWNDSKYQRRFGIVFDRKARRQEQKVAPLVALKTMVFRIAECSRIFVEKLGILDIELFDRVDRSDYVILAAVVDCFSSSDHYENFLVSVMKWMMKARAELWDLVVLLFCRSIGTVFAKNGLHFLPIRQQANRSWDGNSVSGYGFCKIYVARNFIPILSVDFSSIPSYFKFLHSLISLQFHYLPRILRSEQLVPALETSLVAVPCLMHIYRNSEARFTASEIGSRLQKHQKRRRSCKNKNTIVRKRSKLDSCLSDLFNDECDTISYPFWVIPVPGVREVSGYEDDAVSSFIRPDMYIRVMDDEVGRRPFIQKPFLRKKRSFKRQRGQAWGSESDLFLHVGKVEESEGAARRATEIAIKLRTRAQLVMANADLAACKAAMALRIAEAIQLDSSSLLLD